MPVFHIELIRQDPNSDAYEVSTGDVSADFAADALRMFGDSADALGHSDWKFESVVCELRADMIVESEEDAPKAKRSLLCRLMGCKTGGEG